VFLFIKDHANWCSQSVRHVIIVVSNYSLGIYLVHPLIMTLFNDYLEFNSYTLNPQYFVPIFAIIVFITSFVVVRVVSFIPYLRKTVA
jgi:surface polysaccharide O-acyltransferase-like enzyme